MDEINGWSVIASAIIDHNSRLILAENYRGDYSAEDFRLVYVVSTAPIENNGEGWHNGTYFDGYHGRRNKAAARIEFLSRLNRYWTE